MSESPKAFQTLTRKARKEHICCECRDVISKGEAYQYSSGIWDYPESFKQCIKCYKLVELIVNSEDCELFSFCGLIDFFYEQVCRDWTINQVIKHYCENFGLKPNDFKHLFKEVVNDE